MNLYIYNDAGSSGLATDFFIESVLPRLGFNKIIRINSLKNIESNSWIFLYQAKDFFRIKCHLNRYRTITWFQGAVPEEALLTMNSRLRYLLWTFFEYFCLSRSNWCLFVSDSMLSHYRNKYGFNKKNYSIVPCVNRDYKNESDAVIQSWKERPEHSYIYAGSLHKWQAIDESLNLFLYIQTNISNSASLTIVTEDTLAAQQLLSPYNFKNIEVIKAQGDALDSILQKHRYGFLLRKTGTVNNVSTPTKMSTYLSNGVLPIATNAVGYFSDLTFGEIKLTFDAELIDECALIANHLSALTMSIDFESKFGLLIDQYFRGPNSFISSLNNLDSFKKSLKP